MKHTKLIITIAMVALIAATPVFARGHGNGMQNFGHHGFDHDGKMVGKKNVSLMGTIKSIDTEKNTIVVTDVDGKDSTVHINPQTRIAICTNTIATPNTITSAELSAINKNDWVQISKYETNTTILEAHQIRVVR